MGTWGGPVGYCLMGDGSSSCEEQPLLSMPCVHAYRECQVFSPRKLRRCIPLLTSGLPHCSPFQCLERAKRILFDAIVLFGIQRSYDSPDIIYAHCPCSAFHIGSGLLINSSCSARVSKNAQADDT